MIVELQRGCVVPLSCNFIYSSSARGLDSFPLLPFVLCTPIFRTFDSLPRSSCIDFLMSTLFNTSSILSSDLPHCFFQIASPFFVRLRRGGLITCCVLVSQEGKDYLGVRQRRNALGLADGHHYHHGVHGHARGLLHRRMVQPECRVHHRTPHRPGLPGGSSLFPSTGFPMLRPHGTIGAAHFEPRLIELSPLADLRVLHDLAVLQAAGALPRDAGPVQRR